MSKRESYLVWVGFTDGNPDTYTTKDDQQREYRHVAVFARRDDARKQYRDVRCMELVPVKRKAAQ